MQRSSRRDRGFTLLEVLVAFLIAALALTALFRGAVEGQSAGAAAARVTEALSRARSRLAASDVAPLVPGDQQGDDGGGFRWRVRTTMLQAGQPAPSALAPALFAVSVVVSWTEDARERSVQLDTKRLGTAPPRPP